MMVMAGAGFLLLAIPNFATRNVASTLVSIIVYPIVGISDALIYYDARIRREGFDIEMMAGSAEGVPVATPAI